MYLVAAHADRIVGKFDIRFGRIGCSNGYTAVIDRRVAGFDCRRRDRVTGNGRCGIAGAYGNAVAGRQGLGVYTIKTGEFRGQLNVKTVAGFVVYNTDVAFRQAGGISAAFEVQGVVFTEFNFFTRITDEAAFRIVDFTDAGVDIADVACKLSQLPSVAARSAT